MNDTDSNLFDDPSGGSDLSVSGEDMDSSDLGNISDTGGDTSAPASDSDTFVSDDTEALPEDTENGEKDTLSDSDTVSAPDQTDGETAANGETTDTGDSLQEIQSGISEELLTHMDETLTEHSSAFDSFVNGTVSGNGININLDDYSTELLETSVQNQYTILEKMDVLSNLLMLIFLVLIVDYLYRQARRIIKNFMKGDDTNE